MTTKAHAQAHANAQATAHAKTPRTDTRQRILDVAARLFAAHGFAGTSIRDIAADLGLTKAALYYHFSSKEELLHELVAQPILAMREVMEADRDLSAPDERRRYVRDVISAMAVCDTDVVTVFKDPSVAALIDQSVATSGVTHQLSVRLAMGLSRATDPADVRPEHLMRAIAAVAAGYETINNWHVVYPACERFTADDIDVITGLVADVLEAGKR